MITGEGTALISTRSVSDIAGNTTTASSSPAVKIDRTPPTVRYTGNSGTYTIDQTVSITCSASDALSGIASSTCANATGSAWSFGPGTTTLSATATDLAGNTGTGSTSFTVVVTSASLDSLIRLFCGTDTNGANGLITKADDIAAATTPSAKANALNAFDNQVDAKTGNALTAAQPATLKQLAAAL